MKKTKSGFTLVELMVTIAIIVLLTGIIMTNLVKPKSKARDAKKVSDIAQIQLAIELYFDKCKQYPNPTASNNVDINASNSASGGACTDNGTNVTLQRFISKIPTATDGSAYDYYINNSGASGTKTDYILHAKLENSNDSVTKDSLPNSYLSGLSAYGYPDLSALKCYDATNYPTDYCVGPK